MTGPGRSLGGLFILSLVSLAGVGCAHSGPPAFAPAELKAAGIRENSALAEYLGRLDPAQPSCAGEFTDADGFGAARKFWRLTHPEATYNCDDPTFGYPRALHEVWEWLLMHQDLVPDNPDKTFAAFKGRLQKASDPGSISMPSSSVIHSESDAQINPDDPKQIIAAANTDQNQAQLASDDGGKKWSEMPLPLGRNKGRHADPSVAWLKSTPWSACIVYADGHLVVGTFQFDKAHNQWVRDATVSARKEVNCDKPLLRADSAIGNLYVVYDEDHRARFARRAANQWESPMTLSGPNLVMRTTGADIATDAASSLYVFWPETGSDWISHLYVRKSPNQGMSFGNPVQVATAFGRPSIWVRSFIHQAWIYISAAAFSSGADRFVYASWTDLTGDPGCNDKVAAQAPKNANDSCKTRIWFARSIDGGLHWDPPWKINNQNSTNDQFNQRLAVDPATGIIGIIYYDTVTDPDRKKTELFFQFSADNGLTFKPAQVLSKYPTDETGPGAYAEQYGDYNGLTAYDGVFVPTWTDRSAGGREEIWTAVQTCVRPGPPENVAAAASVGRIDLRWSAPIGAKSYRVLRSTSAAGKFDELGVVNTPSFTDATAKRGQTYYYIVRAIGRCESGPSPQVVATTPP